jgi:uncharacterized spore protein YtfJ
MNNNTSESDSIVGEPLTNLQSIFTDIESMNKAAELAEEMIIPKYQFSFGIGGGGGNGRQEQRSTEFEFGGSIVPTAIVVLLKYKSGTDWIRAYELKTAKPGQTLSEVILEFLKFGTLQMASRVKVTREKKEN